MKDWSCNSTLHNYDTDTYSEVEKNKMENPFLLVGACGKIYALTTPYAGNHISKSAGFHCFDPITSRWESLPPPPFYSWSSLSDIAGYAILDQHDLILFCAGENFGFTCLYQFFSFNVCTREWKAAKMKDYDTQGKYKSEYDPYEPYYIPLVKDGTNYPFYGRAETVDGVIYGYLLRTVVAYRFLVEGDIVYLDPPVLYHEAHFPLTMEGCPPIADFIAAPAFSIAPFGAPLLESRCITYMGNNIFCAVETVKELPEKTHFQVVYINTFRLQSKFIEMLDSTVRLVAVDSTFDEMYDQAQIMSCFAPFNLRMEWNPPLTISLCSNLKEYNQEKIPKFCKMFLERLEGMRPLMRHATMLFTKWRCALQNSTDPVIRFFVSYMKSVLEGGPEPDLFAISRQELRLSIEEHTA